MEIQKLNKEIRTKTFEKMKKKSPKQLTTSWYQDDLLYAGTGKTIFIIIPTIGCSWALGDSGGCTMCSYISDSHFKPLDTVEIFELFVGEFEKYELTENTCVKIFVSGSFLNPIEVPIITRYKILKYLSKKKHVKEIVVESRPEYITKNVLKDVFSCLGDKLFELSIGLETSNDFTREEKINKGFSKEDFEKSVETIRSLKNSYNIKSKAYILVKPILTNENEAIEEAIETAKYCERVGVDRVSFTPITIHKGTLLEQLWKKGSYHPPWIWSAIEIINETRKNVSIPSFMDTSGFGSRRGPYNCKKCNKILKNAIIESNIKQSLIEGINCECRLHWIGDKKSSSLNRSKTTIKHLPLI
ncbi:MAG: archaeosine biosynthesis radical SAM protein RaSEA [Methanobrevibacter sp.]|jgi:radical SAM enzyme (TIGR01210 family)|nr:archaeosine biosynthesis radical SAM protein RaSEA [Candidatus Methanovirga basalitermitum]